jgi:hypothetical protein
MTRLRTHLAVAAFAAFAATSATALVAGNASADRDSWGNGRRGETAQLRTDLAYFEAAHLELVRGLERVESAAQRSSDTRTRASVQRIVDETRQRAGRFVGDEGRVVAAPGPIAPSYPTLSSGDFDRLVARVRSTMGTECAEIVRSAARGSYFTVDQALALVKATSMESAKVDVAVALYPRVIDKDRWFLIDEGFSFPSSRQTLRSRVEQLDRQAPATP